jgi:two-component system, response regulator
MHRAQQAIQLAAVARVLFIRQDFWLGGTMRDAEILLVEDNRNCEDLALRSLKKAGYSNVTVARDGVEALGMLLGEECSDLPAREEPSFVLLDMKLPKIDGIGVLQRIRSDERTKRLKVFALSSSEDPRDIEECLNLGVVAILPKPLNAESLKQWLP